ncbi:helix-turn-helix domain-containing protein [Actinoplanes sp. KI2]|uniref:helix-turn-helix domain-containing protein n=1 Tax=Actinoplanes sp. KI2 TaxID=2983315 RepID=UPI0021D5AE28|nr:helix-turn-helix transcriptional regulator [Actinoplanes sp. KI2]MCU7722261.1 helix-turn-helix domain-containing protein [Actinoplanes sp. KI2]
MIGRQIAALRHANGLTQEQLAERAGVSVDVIRRLEQGQRRTARLATLHAIAAALGCKVSISFADGGAQESTSPGQYRDQNESSRSRDPESSDMKRRELLRLVTAATAVVSASSPAHPANEEDLGRLGASERGRLGRAALGELTTVNASLWTAFVLAPAKADVAPAVWAQVQRLTDVLRRPQSTVVRAMVCALNADVFQLAGEILFDANRYADASYCYTLAAMAAREADAMDLWACALTRQAYISVYERRFRDAVPLLGLAADLARRGDPQLATRQWVSSVRAQAVAGVGDQAACERALEQAEQVQALTSPGNGGWLRFDGSRLVEDRASCYVQQRRPDLAEPLLVELLTRHHAGRRRGIALVDLAMTSALRPDVLRLVTYGAAAVDHARQTASGVVVRRLQDLRPHLARFSKDPHVRNLNNEIAHLAIASK